MLFYVDFGGGVLYNNDMKAGLALRDDFAE